MSVNGTDIRRVLQTDFKQSEVQRDELKYYEPLAQRGSYRLKEGLFRTESEQRKFLKSGELIRFAKIGKTLPLGKGVIRMWSEFRSLFSHNATDPKSSRAP
ncbi:MAG: hypothetical protein WBW41_08765 [Verrucomicrobiia bacterium]